MYIISILIVGIAMIVLGMYLTYFTHERIMRPDRILKLYIGSTLIILIGIGLVVEAISKFFA
ncbi:MAG: hypothetical protein ACSHXF_13375 [Aquaticitalea sp.]